MVSIYFLVASMRFAVKKYVDWWSREVEGTILDPFREKSVRNVSAPKYANAEYHDGAWPMADGLEIDPWNYLTAPEGPRYRKFN